MRRSKGGVIAKILEVCLTGPSKTRVVYGSNLNFRTVVPYLDSLIANGHLVITDEKMRRYKTTDRGRELLAVIRKAHEFF